jgi:RimJ/RimL family protein N-acetyltransferase
VGKTEDIARALGDADLFIDASVRGQGVAEAAICQAVRLLFARGHHRIVVDLARDNIAARRVYARCGFRFVGILRHYERDAPGSGHGFHDGVLMELVRDDVPHLRDPG